MRFESVELEGGHSRPRVFSIKGETGRFVMDILIEKAQEFGVNFVEKEIVETVIKNGECLGVKDVNGDIHFFDATVIATGGFTGLYKYTAGSLRNVGVLIGDHIAKGGKASNLEFVQFHPTAHVSKDGEVILISEAVRGRGAILVDSEGKRFVNELAPRDEVSRAIYTKLTEGLEVFLDARNIKEVDRLFPFIYERLLEKGIDMKKDLIPVVPVAHYSIGGIYADVFWRTVFKRLYVIGEAADSGFHGANRLPSNSSLECVSSGLEVSRTITRDLESLGRIRVSSIDDRVKFKEPRAEDLNEIREVMWRYVGIVRDEEGLTYALKYFSKKDLPPQLKALVEALVMCAIERRESRGVHYRKDFPHSVEELKAPSIYFNRRCIIKRDKP